MNLIDKFENMPFQDVGTFNSIFVTTPLLGFNVNEPVLIGNISTGNERKILVGSKEIYMDLTQRKSFEVEKKVKSIKFIKKLEKCSKTNLELPRIFKILKPSEFLIYHAIKQAGEVDGIEELSKNILLNSKTISINLSKLIQLGLIKRKTVSIIGKAGSFDKLTIDTTCNLH